MSDSIWKWRQTNTITCLSGSGNLFFVLFVGCFFILRSSQNKTKITKNNKSNKREKHKNTLTDFSLVLLYIDNKSRRQPPQSSSCTATYHLSRKLKIRRTRHSGHCRRSRDDLISEVLLRTPSYGRVKAGRPAQTYIQPLCVDTGCSSEDLPEAMDDSERGSGISVLMAWHDDDDDDVYWYPPPNRYWIISL